MPSESLPAELLEIIIDSVAASTHPIPSLKACCRVSRVFYQLSRRHLLAGITFTIDKDVHKRARRFLKLFNKVQNIDDNATLAQGIRSVTIKSPSFKADDPDDPLTSRSQGGIPGRLRRIYSDTSKQIIGKLSRKSPPTNNEIIYKVFVVLSQASLEAFTLKNVEERSVFFYAHIVPMLSMTSLRSLHLSNLRDFPGFWMASIIYSLPNLKVLKVINVGLGDLEAYELDHYQSIQESQSAVQELCLGYSNTTRLLQFFAVIPMHRPLSTGLSGFPRLRKVSIQVNRPSAETIWYALADLFKQKIEILHLEPFCPHDTYCYYEFFRFDELPALREIQFDLYPTDLKDDLSERLVRIAERFGSATISSGIDTVSIRIIMTKPFVKPLIKELRAKGCLGSRSRRLPLALMSGVGWRKLDEALWELAFVRWITVGVEMRPGPADVAEQGLWAKLKRKRQAYACPKVDKKLLMPLLANDPYVELSISMEMEFYE